MAPRFVIRDRDDKFGRDFDRVVEAIGARVLRTPVRAPRANAVCERFLGSVRRECLDHVLVLGDWQLFEVLVEYCCYFNDARPHQGIGQLVPCGSSFATGENGSPETGEGGAVFVDGEYRLFVGSYLDVRGGLDPYLT